MPTKIDSSDIPGYVAPRKAESDSEGSSSVSEIPFGTLESWTTEEAASEEAESVPESQKPHIEAYPDTRIAVPSEGEVYYPERFTMWQTEGILQVIADPLAEWDGSRLHSLVEAMHADEQGVMPFPPPNEKDCQQIQK